MKKPHVFVINMIFLYSSLDLEILFFCVDLLTSDALNQLQLDCQDGNRNTALHLACLKGHEESALASLEKCSDAVTQMSKASNKMYVVSEYRTLKLVWRCYYNTPKLHPPDRCM